jgi:hypothetical protein
VAGLVGGWERQDKNIVAIKIITYVGFAERKVKYLFILEKDYWHIVDLIVTDV